MSESYRYKLTAVHALLKRVHIHVGLFNLTAMVVFAITGIAETFPAQPPIVETHTVAYSAPANLPDQQVADHFVAAGHLRHVFPVLPGDIHRDRDNALVIEFRGINGGGTVTLLESQQQARIDRMTRSPGQFVARAHEMTLYWSPPDFAVRLWAFYVDCSIVSLAFMSVTGPWLWLTSRRDLWWARATFALGVGTFVALWAVTR